jgi:short-subunit dehydrogenase
MEVGSFIYAIGDPNLQGSTKGETELELLDLILKKLESLNFRGKFILVSSNAANPDSGYSSPEYRKTLVNDYIARKIQLENRTQNSSLNTSIIRAPAVIGEDMNATSHVMKLILNPNICRIFSLPIFRGTIELITNRDLAIEVDLIIRNDSDEEVIQPSTVSYRWRDLARYLIKERKLTAYSGSILSKRQERFARFLPLELRFLTFPHWITKGDEKNLIELREQNVIKLLKKLISQQDVEEKWHVVTGSASGLGAETVKKLLSKGYKVIGIDITPISKSTATQEFLLSPKFKFLEGDLCNEEFLQKVKDYLREVNLKGIFCVAGIGPRSAISENTPSLVKKIFALNFIVPIELHQLLLERHQNRTYFVFVGSSSGVTGLPKFSAYSSSKSAISTYFFSAMCEEPKTKLDILGVIPSGMKTNFQESNGVPSSPLDKVLLADPSKIASTMVSWMENSKRKSKIKHFGISSAIFLVIRNLPYPLRSLVVKTLTEGTR